MMMISRSLKHLIDDGALVDIVLEHRYWSLFRRWDNLRCTIEPEGHYDYHYKLHPSCPAAMIENRWVSHNKMSTGSTHVGPNRIDIFANALGVSLPVSEKIPYVLLGDEDRAAALKIYGHLRRPLLYVQADANEDYRTWRNAGAFCVMAKKMGLSVVARGIRNAKIIDRSTEQLDILTSCALIEAADVVVTTDSMALHAAAALGRPCVAVFGPIGASTRTSTYPQCTVVTASGFECMPCWRNQVIRCSAGGENWSSCLDAVSATMAMQVVVKILGLADPLLMRRKTVERSH